MQEGWFGGADGTRLYYRTFGEGIPLLLNDGIGCSGFIWDYLIPQLAEHYQVVHWHYKGHGFSEAPADFSHVGVEDLVADLAALCEHLKLPPAVVVGHSMGVQVIYEFARRHPDKTRGIIALCGSYGHPLDTFHDNVALRTAFPHLRALAERFPTAARTLWTAICRSELAYQVAVNFEVNKSLLKRRDFSKYFAEISSVDALLFIAMLGKAQEHDARSFLPEIKVPTLIITGDRDTFTPTWLSDDMQKLVPGSELLTIPGGSHATPIEAPEIVNPRILQFMATRIAAAPKPAKPSKASAPKPKAAKPAKPRAPKKPAKGAHAE